MKYLSVCSGIEAATCAWHHMGWEPVAFSEIEKFPSAVLAHHYPSVPNWGDMTKFKEWPDANVDVLVGGTPCQSFSVAGLRKGLDDPRGNLMLTYLAIAKRYRPQWLVWENVPGVLSSNGGRDFGTFLGMLGELGYGFAYRVLDAQFFGVAQRRRRVFVVGHLGNWQRAAAVLFERHSLSGHPAPSRQARQGTTRGVAAGVDERGLQHTVGTLCADTHPGAYSGQDAYTGKLVPQPVAIQGTLIGRGENAGPQGSGADVSGAMFTLTKTDVYAVAQPVAFYDYLGSQNGGVEIGISPTLKKKDGVAITQPVAMRESGQGYWMEDNIAGTLRAEGEDCPSRPSHVIQQTAMQVRRLLPEECEKLQGFLPGYTNIPWRGKPESPDGPRYKALGNSMAVPCMVWIGERINEVSKL